MDGVDTDAELVPMLVSRAETLHEWAADDALWDDG
jgi:hypothetical protein